MTDRPGWIVATQHDDCAECDALVDKAIEFADRFRVVAAETGDGSHLANVERELSSGV